MNEHDTLDDWPELRELRELHQGDRMPTDVRERVLRRAELPPLPAFPAAANESAEPQPWGEPSRAPAPYARRARWLVAGVGLAAAAGLALWLQTPPERVSVESEHPAPLELAARPYSSDELRALGIQPGATEVRVTGMLVSGSLTRLPPLPPNLRIRCGYHFHLRQPGLTSGDGIHVEYARCRAPELLIDDGATCVEVTAIGRLRADGHVDATRITPKVGTGCAQAR